MDYEKAFKNYSKKVLSFIQCDPETKERLAVEIEERLFSKYLETNEPNPYRLLGNPYALSRELKGTFSREEVHSALEYISPVTILGLPLLHINRKKNGVAKGIFAFGSIAMGIFAFGGVAIGLIAFGGVSLGVLCALGGVALGALASIGGFSASLGYAFGGFALSLYFAVGGLAIAREYAIGGLAMANIAVGDNAIGNLAIYIEKGNGTYLISLKRSFSELQYVISTVKENADTFFISILKLMKSFY